MNVIKLKNLHSSKTSEPIAVDTVKKKYPLSNTTISNREEPICVACTDRKSNAVNFS